MTARPAVGAKVATGLIAPVVALAGCSLFSSNTNKQGAPTTAPAPPAVSAAVSAFGDDYCSVVIKVNTDAGTMVNKTFVPTDRWTRAQVATLIDFTLSHRTEFLAITPPELKSAVEAEMQWMQAIKDAGYDLQTTNVPSGTYEAMGKITNYQISKCGISYG